MKMTHQELKQAIRLENSLEKWKGSGKRPSRIPPYRDPKRVKELQDALKDSKEKETSRHQENRAQNHLKIVQKRRLTRERKALRPAQYLKDHKIPPAVHHWAKYPIKERKKSA